MADSPLTPSPPRHSGSCPVADGKASLELIIHPLDHRLAAQFWGISDPRLAVRVNAVVGGTPAYRREFAGDDAPAGPDDFDNWVLRTVLNPASPLFREARYLLAEEPDLRDAALYHSVLAAVAEGNTTRGRIANYLGRRTSDLAHPLDVLQDAGLLVRETDAFRENRSYYRIAEPLITFYHAVMRPAWDQLERPGNASRVWRAAHQRFATKVLGPRFEQICREWSLYSADDQVFGGLPIRVGHGTVTDPSRRTSHEVDVAVVGSTEQGGTRLLAIGEVKWGEVMGVGHLDRLRRVRALLANSGRYDTSQTRLACFGGAGFSPELRAAASSDEVVLVDIDQLYR